MDTEAMWFARCAVSAIAFIGAAYVESTGNDGWGWLIVGALLALPLYSS